MKLTDLIGETTEYDKKEMLEERKSKSWLKSVSAFANGIGGALIFGIADDDTLVGLSDAKADADKISEKIKATLDPVPQIILSIPHEDGKDFIILKVLSGQETPYYYYADGNRIAYVRVGNESVPADAATLKRLVLHGSGISYDSLPTHFKTVDYAFTKLRSVYRARTGNELEDADFISFGLSTDDGMLTNAGALLSDECPIRHSRLFCTRWYGLDKASGVMEALDDKEFSGSLVSLLQNGEEFVKNNTKKRWKKTGQGRLEMPEYPEQAVLECIVNALIHRDYTQVGSEVHIDIFDDRMEIYSPGGMYDGSVVQDLDVDHIPSKRRNPVIADVFSRMHYMERRGSGFKRIKSDYQNAVNYRPQTAPKFYSTNTSFFVTLYNLNYGVPIGKTGVSDEKQVFEPPETGVSDEKQAFEAHIATLPLTKKTQGSILLLYHAYGFKQAFSRTDVSQILSITLSPAGELLRKMKNAGLIESVKGQGKGQYRFCQH
jgi:predicted HTH transcriptional regulator